MLSIRNVIQREERKEEKMEGRKEGRKEEGREGLLLLLPKWLYKTNVNFSKKNFFRVTYFWGWKTQSSESIKNCYALLNFKFPLVPLSVHTLCIQLRVELNQHGPNHNFMKLTFMKNLRYFRGWTISVKDNLFWWLIFSDKKWL